MDNTELSGPTPAEAFSPEPDHAAKRRKVRKGTQSCWECKRRKVRCVFPSVEDVVCSNCRRRGSTCVSQDLPEELAPPKTEQIGDRIVRVEDLVQSLAKQLHTASRTNSTSTSIPSQIGVGVPTPSYSDPDLEKACDNSSPRENEVYCPLQTILSPPGSDINVPAASKTGCVNRPKYAKITQALLAALPCPEDVNLFLTDMKTRKYYFHLLNLKSYGSLHRDGLTPVVLPSTYTELADPDSHPVCLARKMILMAIILQGHASHHMYGLVEPPHIIVKRLMEAVSSLVTNNEELHGTMESLECVMFECLYQKSRGNIRRAWLVMRRAMLIAQMMGLHRPRARPVKTIDPCYDVDPSFIWYRMVYIDRYLSLLLGFPQGSADTGMASEAALASEAPLGRLDRQHAIIASRILERNETGPLDDDLGLTQDIDAALLKVSKSMPAKFWLAPDFRNLEEGSEEEFWETARTSSQVFYYNMLNQLHLPYLLRFDPDGKYDYSKISCVNASREILARHVAFREYNKNSSCHRVIDFLALMAATTLLLAHFDSQLHRKANNVFAHQRLSDRAMVERVLEAMEKIVNLEGAKDILNEQSARVLRALLHIEDDAAEGRTYSALTVQQSGNMPEEDEGLRFEGEADNFKVLRMCIPYFGQIRIAREGISSQERAPVYSSMFPLQSAGKEHPRAISAAFWTGGSSSRLELLAGTEIGRLPSGDPNLLRTEPLTMDPSQSFSSEPFISQAPDVSHSGALSQQYELPDMMAEIDDWAFQGVDTALFDTLMRGAYM